MDRIYCITPTVTFLLTAIEQQLSLTTICDVIEENWSIFCIFQMSIRLYTDTQAWLLRCYPTL